MKNSQYSKYFEIPTEQGNKWLFLLSKSPSDKNYKGISSISILIFTYIETKSGLKAIKLIPTGGISIFHCLLFEQYKTLMNIKEMDPIELIKRFFLRNGFIMNQGNEENGSIKTIGTCKDGIIHGELKLENNCLEYHSFLNNEMLNSNQQDTSKHNLEILQGLIEEELNTPEFDRNIYQYQADVLEGIKS